MHHTASTPLQPPLELERAARIASRDLPGWRIAFLPDAVPERRWRAQTRQPLTRIDIVLGHSGAVYGPTLDAVTTQVRIVRIVTFMDTMRRWRR